MSTVTQDSQKIVIDFPISTYRLMIWGAGSCVLVSLVPPIAVIAGGGLSNLPGALGLTALLGGTAAFVAIKYYRQLSEGKPALVIDQQGITDNLNRVGFIPWSEIASVEERRHRGMSPYLAINVKHLEDLLARQKMPRRLLLNYYAAMYGGPLTVSPAVLQLSVNDLKEHI